MITSALFAGVRSGSVWGSRIGSLLMELSCLRRSLAVGECFDEEGCRPVEGDAAGLQIRNVDLKHVVHALPHLELHRRSRAGGSRGVLARIVQQPLVAADLDQQRRESREIAEQGRGE